jgi:hypothetical protein
MELHLRNFIGGIRFLGRTEKTVEQSSLEMITIVLRLDGREEVKNEEKARLDIMQATLEILCRALVISFSVLVQ